MYSTWSIDQLTNLGLLIDLQCFENIKNLQAKRTSLSENLSCNSSSCEHALFLETKLQWSCSWRVY